MGNKSIALNTIYNIILKVFQLVVPILIGPYLARILDIHLYGVYNTALSQIDFFMIFAAFGIQVYGLREISKVRDNKEKRDTLFTNLFVISIITNILSIVAYLLFVTFFVNSDSIIVYYILVIKIFANIFMVEWVNEATENYGFITIKTIIVRVIYVVGLFVFVRDADDIISYSLLVVLSSFVNNILSYIYIKREFKFEFAKLQLGRHIKPLLSVLVISNINLFYTQLDKLLLGFTVNEVSVSFYYLPQNIMTIITTVLTAMVMVSISRLSYYNGNSMENEYNDLLFKMYRSYMLVVFPACIGVACLSKEIMYLYGGVKYVGAYIILAIFAIRTIGNAIYTVYANQILYIKGKEKFLLKALALGAVLNVIFNMLLIKLGVFMPETAVLTTFIAEIIMITVINIYIRKVVKINIRLLNNYNIKYLISSLLFIPITIFVKSFKFSYILNVVIIVPICAGVYFLILYFSKDKMLFELMKNIMNKLQGVKKG